MMTKRALILFAHGARDSRWAEPFQRLQQITQAQLSDVAVELAFLEFMTPDLPALVQALIQKGCAEVTVVPVFFGQGGHVLRDLPMMVEALQKEHPTVSLKVANAVGEDPDVLDAIAQYCIGALPKNQTVAI